ncbi:MAG: translation initiation factor IF-2 [Gemmatimonadota bacterium]
MRVVELAEDLKVSTADLLALLRAMGIPVPDGDAPVKDADVARVLARVERERRSGKKDTGEAVQAAIEESQAPTRRRRRRRAEDVEPEPEPEVEEAAEVEEAEETADQAVPDEASEEAAGEVPEVAAEEQAEPEPEVASVAPPADEELVDEGEVAPSAETLEEAEPPEMAVDDEGEDEEDVSKPKRRLKLPDGMAAAGAEQKRRARTAEKVKQAEGAAPPRPTPAASAGPGGQVRIQADGYNSGGRQKGKKKGKRRERVDQDAVQDNIQRVMAELKGGGKKRRRKSSSRPSREEQEAQEEQERQREEEEAKTVRVIEFLTVAELSELIDVPSTDLVSAAFKNLGLMITINQRLDFDQIELLLEEFNFQAVREEAYSGAEESEEEIEEDPALLEPRPPVVTVMGHVDHGKTLLLDSIRKTNVVGGESGGITQHIGAYHVELEDDRTISFLDTPGHAAFTAMRARGADVTDIVVLVVAADDSIMPQTIEAISHAKNAGVPLVVAINKTDLPAANAQKVKQELLQQDVTAEEFGGDVLIAEVSAKTGQGIDDLLEKILLQAEILELKANPDREAQAAVIEAKLDVGKGPVVTVLVQRGTLRVGDAFIVGKYEGRVRAMLDERGKSVEKVPPGLPVQILGAGGIPQAGDTLQVMEADKASEIAQTRQRLEREKQLRVKERGIKLGDLAHFMKEGEVVALPVVVKADVDGSVQALSDSLEQLSTEEVQVQIIHRGVGAVNESDVLLAETSGAIIIGFRVRPDTNARQLAEQNGVEIHLYDVIYEAVDDITKAMEGMLSPERRETVLGAAEVREVFRISKVGTIAGCYVTDGVIDRKGHVRLVRDGSVVYSGEIESLKRFKDDVKEVRDGFECGISIANFNDIKTGDVIECYKVEEIARTLAGSGSSAGRE